MPPADPLDRAALHHALAGQLLGHPLFVLDQTTSTNDVVAQMAPEHAEGLVVIAETQTAGRGQYGRRWESAPGQGLWLSLLLRPQIGVADSARLTDFLARAIQATIRECCALETTIKPPNDIYCDRGKLAGVLVEMRAEAGSGHCAIVGLGINLNQTAEDFPPELRATAASLRSILGRKIARTDFAIALLRQLDQRYAQLRA